ncbi:recombinase family protein [Rhodobacteraceae bacterium KMM 6894]|nr:recombinase family protein [Rhodobacteraceae bacterium KMM 6894]
MHYQIYTQNFPAQMLEFSEFNYARHKSGKKPVKMMDSLPMDVSGEQICSQANQRLLVKEPEMTSSQFIAYYRVSTTRQGENGLGIEAQRRAARQFVTLSGGEMDQTFTEVESGKKRNRLELERALAACRETGATLLIAKLDRLARNVAVIANLLESGVRFVAVDMPNADRFMLHVYAAMAEEEGRRISERTKAALASAKTRGIELGSNGKRLAKKNREEALSFALGLEETLRRLIHVDGLSFRSTADRLNAMKIPTAHGGRWHSTTVHRVWERVKK